MCGTMPPSTPPEFRPMPRRRSAAGRDSVSSQSCPSSCWSCSSHCSSTTSPAAGTRKRFSSSIRTRPRLHSQYQARSGRWVNVQRGADRVLRSAPRLGRIIKPSLRVPVRSLRVLRHVDPGVDVRRAAEVPHQRWALQPPDVPRSVLAERILLVEREVDLVETAVRVDLGHHLLRVRWPVRREQVVHYVLHEVALVGGELSDRDAREVAVRPLQVDFVLCRSLVYERHGPLLAVQRLEHGVCAAPLFPVDVARMAGVLRELDGVAVEDRAAECGIGVGVAVRAERAVSAGHHPLELILIGVSEERYGVVFEAAAIVLHLGEYLRIPLLGCQAAQDRVEHLLLVRREYLADILLYDHPVRADLAPKRV